MSKNNTFYIRPLEQQVAYIDPLYKPKEVWCLDQLDQDLSFQETIGTARGNETPSQFLGRMIDTRDFKSRSIRPVDPTGWVKVQADPSDGWENIWKLAMKKLGQKELINPKQI